MRNFLQEMGQSSAARAAAVTRHMTAKDFDKPAYSLRPDRFDVIAEIKNRSPAEGVLSGVADKRADRARSYAAGGAVAISVLTEPQRFDGDLAHLEEVVSAVAASETPVMRKDFLVDVVQIQEAKAVGASGVLLIAAMLDDSKLHSMLDCAFEHDLFVLLEAFDAVDLGRSRKVLQRSVCQEQVQRNKLLLGVNTRDLRTLEVDATRFESFSHKLPTDVICVAESGQHSAADAASVAEIGYRMSLVGTALMRAENAATLIGDMLLAGRSAA